MAKTVSVRAGGVYWRVVPDYREAFLGPEGLRLPEWLRNGRAQVVKHGPHRTVYKVTLANLQFYVKHYPLADTRAWLRQLVRPSKARMEYNKALAAAANGIPTVVPLAVGERATGLKPADSFLITRSLEDTETLSHFIDCTWPLLEATRRFRIRQRLAVALGKLIARMHDTGLTHNDLHAANLLIHVGPDDTARLYVIDLHAVRFGPALGWRASRANLTMLNRWFVMGVSRADRMRFWRVYCAERRARFADPATPPPMLRAQQATRARNLEARTWESNWYFWRHRDRRCLGTNRYFRRLRGNGIKGHAVADLDPEALSALLADPDGPFCRPGIVLLKDSPSSTVAEFDFPVAGVVRRVIYKRFRVTRWSDPWAALFRRTPALRSWINGHGLRHRGLPTARPLAVFHRRRFGLAYEGYLLTEKIPSAMDLHRYVDSLGRLAPAEQRYALRRLIDQVARLIREMHRRRLSHRDLKAANVLVTSGKCRLADTSMHATHHSPLTTPSLWLIDLVGLTSRHRLSRSCRVQNLARLHASFCQNRSITRGDKLRFLRTYLQFNLVGRVHWKRWWHAIAAATNAKVARNLRNGRVLA
jgi:tRNA A-37 threonylcarbamoyl transferase component Bud32